MNESDDKFYVYGLICPINHMPFYIGKGCGRRAYNHLTRTDNSNALKTKYIENLRMLGFEPQVKFLATGLNESFAYNLENNFIKFIAARFLYFTNKVGVANGSYCTTNINYKNIFSIKQRKSSRIYKPLTDEQKENISKKLKGRKLPESHRKNISNYRMGKGFSLTQNELLELRKTFTVKEIAEKFGISIGPIKKLIKKYKQYKYKTNKTLFKFS